MDTAAGGRGWRCLEPDAQPAVRCSSGRRHGPGGGWVHGFYLVAWLPWLGSSCLPGPGTWKCPGKVFDTSFLCATPHSHSPYWLPSWAIDTLARTNPTSCLPSLLLNIFVLQAPGCCRKVIPMRASSREAHTDQPVYHYHQPNSFAFPTLYSAGHPLTKPCFFLLNICFLLSIFPHYVSLEIKGFPPNFHSLSYVQILGNSLS